MLIDAEIMAQNRNPRWRPSAILDFRKPDFWARGPLGLPIFHLGTKFGAKILIDAILDLLHHHIGPSTKSFHWPVKFYANPMHSFEDMTIWNFCRFGLKCLFTPPKFWFLGVWTPKRDWSSSRPPKGTSLAETALTCQFWCRSVDWSDLCARRRNKKKRKKARKETYSGKLGVRSDHPRWLSDMWSCLPGGLREIVLSFKFR